MPLSAQLHLKADYQSNRFFVVSFCLLILGYTIAFFLLLFFTLVPTWVFFQSPFEALLSVIHFFSWLDYLSILFAWGLGVWLAWRFVQGNISQPALGFHALRFDGEGFYYQDSPVNVRLLWRSGLTLLIELSAEPLMPSQKGCFGLKRKTRSLYFLSAADYGEPDIRQLSKVLYLHLGV